MPHCPRCGKRCKTDEKVVRHLNQPGSSCAKLIDDLISIPLPLQGQVQDLPLDGDQDGADMGFAHDDYYPTESSNDIEIALNDQDPSFFNIQGSQYREDFAGAAKVYGTGETFMGKFDSDGFAEQREKNIYYPFASKVDWEMAAFLLRSRMSMAMIDDFLKLELVSTSLEPDCPKKSNLNSQIRPLPLSFRTAKELRGRAEMLPAGPEWRCKPWETTHPTKGAVKLFYRDPLECIESLLTSPLASDDIEFTPYRVFKTAEKSIREYNEWMSGNVAWEMQVCVSLRWVFRCLY